jgi:hypothetical protein
MVGTIAESQDMKMKNAIVWLVWRDFFVSWVFIYFLLPETDLLRSENQIIQ